MENLNGNDSGMANAASPALIEESEADNRPELKTAIGGRFKIIKSLGSSETYSLFLAQDNDGNPIRLKVLSEIAALDSTKIELFYLEAYAASRLSHPNIAKTSEPEYIDNVHFCTSAHYSKAISLRSLLDRQGWLTPELAASIAGQVAEALEYAHARGVLHLNLHPANILFGSDGKAVVTGFGISSSEEYAWARLERSRRLPAQYMSPEQAQELHINHMSDLYSLGVLLYEMLTDRLPFDSHDPAAIKLKHISHAPQAPQVFRQGLSALQSALVMSLLEKSPEMRCGNRTQLRSVLSSLAASASGKPSVRVTVPPDTTPDEPGAKLANPSRNPFYEDTPAIPVHKEEREIKAEPDDSIKSEASEATPSQQISNRVAEREVFEPPTITVIDPPLIISETVNTGKTMRQLPPHKADAQKRLAVEPASRPKWRWVTLVLLSAVVAVLMSILLARGNQLSRLLRRTPPAETVQAPSDSYLTPDTNTPAPAQVEVEKKDSLAQKEANPASRKQVWRSQPVIRPQMLRAKRPVNRSRAVKLNQTSKQRLKAARLRLLMHRRH